jgi:transposase-like protein
VRAPAHRHGISTATLQKWRKRISVSDAAVSPEVPHSTVMSPDGEAVAIALRRHTLLPLDEV